MPAPVVGVNVPWLGVGYGHDLGPNQAYPDWPVTFDPGQVEALFERLSLYGVRHIRFWLFEDGEGILFDERGRPTGVHPLFLSNLEVFCGLASRWEMRVYWVILDANSLRRRPDLVTRTILSNTEAMQQFVENTLAPVLPLIEPTTWAIDLCNEPEGVAWGELGNGTGLGFDWDGLVEQLNGLADGIRLRTPNLATSVGSGYHEYRTATAGLYNKLRIDFLDFHSHGRSAQPALQGGMNFGRPMVVGELGAADRRPPGAACVREDWLSTQTEMSEHLSSALSGEFIAIFLWFLSDLASHDSHSLVFDGEDSRVLEYLGQRREGSDGAWGADQALLASQLLR